MTQSQIPVAIAAALGSFCLGIVLPIPPALNFFDREEQLFQTTSSQVEIPTQHRFLAKTITDLKVESQRSLQPAIPKAFQGKTFAQVKLHSRKVVALTFDDGPWPESTAAILGILRQQQVQATFFMVGRYVERFPKIAQQVASQGHDIENHSWSHTYRPFTPAQAAQEINRTSQIITKITGSKPTLFRPPGGFLHNGLVSFAQKKNYGVALWSADSQDYRTSSAEQLRKRVLSQVKPGGIVLLHDGGGNRNHTIAALPGLIADLKKQGYEFVTVSELLSLAEQDRQVIAAKQKSAAKSPQKTPDKPAQGPAKP